MSAVDILLTISEYLISEAITLHPERCLNAWHRAVGCTLCAEACPAEKAIVVTNGKPALDNEACRHCGLCLHHCPTGAFTRPDPLPGKLIKTIVALPDDDRVDLLCPFHATPDSGPAPRAVQTKRCLAALPPATLLELTTQEREIWLDDTFCSECPLAEIHPTLAQTVDEANAWASLLENTVPISLHTRHTNPPPPINRPVHEADRPPVSRRGLFGVIKKLGPENPGEVVADEGRTPPAQTGRPIPLAERLPHFVPRQRAKILAIIDRATDTLASPDQPAGKIQPAPSSNEVRSALPVAEVKVDNNQCSACNLCARFCPTEALTYLSDEERFALAFHPRLCLGLRCNICAVACPEEVVSLKPATISPDLLDKKPRYLAAGRLTSCQKCGTTIAAGLERPTTCYVCRLKVTTTGLFG